MIYKYHPFLYFTKIKDYYVVYNPQVRLGLNLLNEKTYQILKLIRNKNLLQIEKTLEHYKISEKEASKIINFFISRKLIYSGEVPPPEFYKPARLTAWMHLTTACNFRCKYCYLSKLPTKIETMQWTTAKRIIDRLIDTAVKNAFPEVYLKCAGGEPLLVFNLLKSITEYTQQVSKKKNIKISVGIVTNGSLITSKIAQFLTKNKIKIAVSLDGPQKYNDTQRVFSNGQGTFNSVIKGINMLKEAGYPAEMLRIGVVVSNYNIDGLYELTDMLLENKLGWCYSFFRENEYADPNIKKCPDDKIVRVLSNCFNLISRKMYRELPIIALLDRVNLLAPHVRSCSMGKSYMAISPSGKVSFCHMLLENPLFSITDTEKNSDLLHLLDKNDKEGISKFTVDDIETCKNCQWKYVCAAGCPLVHYFKTGEFLRKSPYCKVFKAMIPKLIQLLALHTLKFGTKIQPSIKSKYYGNV